MIYQRAQNEAEIGGNGGLVGGVVGGVGWEGVAIAV